MLISELSKCLTVIPIYNLALFSILLNNITYINIVVLCTFATKAKRINL